MAYHHKNHAHPLYRNYSNNGWVCDGRKFPGGCQRGITDFGQTSGVPRYRCSQCDFDLCDRCLGTSSTLHTAHSHPLRPCLDNNGWVCDGRRLPGGCKRHMTDFNQSNGVPRYRCASCDFDLCDLCLDNLSYTHSSHPHPLIPCSRNFGWFCDGARLPGGCKRGANNPSSGVARYRCSNCDFDLCDQCMVCPHTGTTTNIVRKLGAGSGAANYYCGQYFGILALPLSDGFCGPNNGPQCADCKMYQKSFSVACVQPSFISANPSVVAVSSLQPYSYPCSGTNMPPVPEPMEQTSNEEKMVCKICFDAQINCVFIPCGHLATCMHCAEALPIKACPICRKTFQTIVQTYLS